MAKLTLNDITSGYSAPTRINANNDAIETALENTLSRDGTSPNQMEAHLDMNGYRILNISSPQSPTDPARLVDITGLITLTGMPIPSVTGNAGKLLFTDGVDLFWGDVQADALPIFDTDDPGAVPASGGSATVILWGDGAWATPASRNVAMFNANNTFSLAQRFPFDTVTYAGDIDIDTSTGNNYKLTLTGNSNLDFINAVDGTELNLYIIQDGTGSRTVNWIPSISWTNGEEPTLQETPAAVDLITLRYDGTTWYGDFVALATPDEDDASSYDLALTRNEDNVDLFRRLGSPIVARAWDILIDDGVVISSRTVREQAMKFSGAFPSGTTINVVNRGYVIGKGGKGAKASWISNSGSADFGIGVGDGQDGGDAIEGPATDVTVNFNNSAGRVWAGGGGGGGGGASAAASICMGGAGGGGAGCGEGGEGGRMKQNGDVNTAAVADGEDGILGLDGSDAGGAGSDGDVGTGGGSSKGDGGDGGDYGQAGSNGTAATDVGLIIAPSNGGSAGRAVTAGYTGTFTFTAGSGSPNVKGAF